MAWFSLFNNISAI